MLVPVASMYWKISISSYHYTYSYQGRLMPLFWLLIAQGFGPSGKEKVRSEDLIVYMPYA